MPKGTFIIKEESAMPEHKSMKDSLTLLLCGNTGGICMVKPFLVYYSDNPSVFKKINMIKSKLGVV